MRKDELRSLLEAKGIGSKGITNRIYWCSKIEEDYNINLDNICRSEGKVKRLVEDIESNSVYKKSEKRNLIISLTKYVDLFKGN
ncbi:hypothetical protein HYG86_02220 [Alkalicella caledoniensis]|uniref:Uncharacterized protein n=1 Tax=Alkalicella caledoniensis TaxID=2731377 RepID=A0A7G9W4Q2_ALKCA|nr:hypothetical protein [Alkalicella caledoniensis]QNO13664.1 hypothetical protein HYG86_02220 [Alkalicella caledoniensis]